MGFNSLDTIDTKSSGQCLKLTNLRMPSCNSTQNEQKKNRLYYRNLERATYQYAQHATKTIKNEMMSKDKEINDAMQQLILKNAQHAMELGKFALQIKKYKDRIIRVSKNKKDGWVYIATTQQYAQQNRFKVGHTPNLRARIYAYKTGRLGRNDEMYPCDSFDSYNRKLLYEIIKNKLRSV